MKRLFFIVFAWFLQACLSGCSDYFEARPPAIVVLKSNNELKNSNGIWLYKGTPFNGYIEEKEGMVLTAKLPIINGKENGMAYGWYPNGKLKYSRHFLNGNRDGLHKGWYENGILAFEYFFKNDKYEGEQKTYFKNGTKWQIFHYVNGYEEGKQKMWNASGKVVNNFTVKNGKLYGVIGRYDCMSVQNN